VDVGIEPKRFVIGQQGDYRYLASPATPLIGQRGDHSLRAAVTKIRADQGDIGPHTVTVYTSSHRIPLPYCMDGASERIRRSKRNRDEDRLEADNAPGTSRKMNPDNQMYE